MRKKVRGLLVKKEPGISTHGLVAKYGLLLLPILVLLLILSQTSLKLEEVEIVNARGSLVKTSLPIWLVSQSKNTQTYLIKGKLNYDRYSQRVVNVKGDDCIESIRVNGQLVPLAKMPQAVLCDWGRGFDLDLGEYLTQGENQLEIGLKNFGGRYSLFLDHTFHDPLYRFLTGSLLLFVLLFFYCLFREFKFNKKIIAILFSGFLVRVLYSSYTPFYTRSYDVGGHLDYLIYLVREGVLPQANFCWECYQPPLYYLLAALVVKTTSFWGFTNFYSALQVFSLLLSFGFLFFSTLLFRRLFTQRHLTELTVALITFWPSGIIHSVRIGNDALFYLGYAAGFYFLYQWWRDGELKNLYLAAVFSLFTLVTKMNGVVLVSLTLSAIVLKFWQRRRQFPHPRQAGLIVAALTLGTTAVFYQAPWYRGFNETTKALHSGLLVGNRAVNYLRFDLKTFTREPFTTAWADWGGRQYYWNYLFKTSLFGEFRFQGAIVEALGTLISFLFLGLFAYTLAGCLMIKSGQLKKFSLLILNTALLVTASIVLRIRVPCSCAGDFRYVFPILVSAIPFYGLALENFKKRQFPVLEYVGHGLGGGFVLSVIAFFLLAPF